jgi:metallo-beta-lactamase class B
MRLLFPIFALSLALSASAEINPEWTTPLPPFQIADNLYYVGSEELAAYLVTTSAGNILINANLETSPPQIRASVEKLGFQWADTKILLNGQAHFDHMAGAAQVMRETHAKNMVMEGDAEVVESGGHSDFLASSGSVPAYPPAHVDRVLHDGDTVELGGVVLTAHKTPGHTRGCTTWTFPVHLRGEPADQLRHVVIVGGTGFWSDFHFVDRPGEPPSYPGIAEDFARTFRVLRSLPCDIFLGAHGSYFGLKSKLPRLAKEGPRVFLDADGYKDFVAQAQEHFETELKKEEEAARPVKETADVCASAWCDCAGYDRLCAAGATAVARPATRQTGWWIALLPLLADSFPALPRRTQIGRLHRNHDVLAPVL